MRTQASAIPPALIAAADVIPPVAQPSCVTGKMRDYQLRGLSWMVHMCVSVGIHWYPLLSIGIYRHIWGFPLASIGYLSVSLDTFT